MYVRKFTLYVALAGLTAAVALSGCAQATAPQSTASPSSAPSADATPTYDGPLVFVGDDLVSLLPSADSITELFPGASAPADATNVLEVIGDGGGPAYDPAVCGMLYREQSLGGVGARVAQWPTTANDWTGSAVAVQFASPEQAAERFAELEGAVESCESFTSDGAESFTDVAVSEGADSTAVAGVLVGVPGERQWQAVNAYAVAGNTLVVLTHPFTGDAKPDTQAIADHLASVGDGAATAVRETLAGSVEEPMTDPEVTGEGSWAEWEITTSSVGPVALGMTADEILEAVPGAEITEAEFRPSRLSSADGAAHMWITFDSAGQAAQLAVGTLRSIEPIEEGTALPTLEGHRIGAPVSAIVDAFPGGTFVHSGVSGDSIYAVTDREGRGVEIVLTTGDRSPDASVLGIRIADGTSEMATLFE